MGVVHLPVDLQKVGGRCEEAGKKVVHGVLHLLVLGGMGAINPPHRDTPTSLASSPQYSQVSRLVCILSPSDSLQPHLHLL